MKVPVSWLKEYVGVPISPLELADRLTTAGNEVTGLTVLGDNWENVYVGQVFSIAPHPNADRLKLVTIDIEAERATVVCGAPNVALGQKVPFAKVGASLTDPQTGNHFALTAAKIRGIESAGMVCSERELGLGSNHTGILVLPPDAPVGVQLTQYLGDTILDIDVTPNRPDCLSVLGIAREVAALTDGTAREPNATYHELGSPIHDQISIHVKDPNLCLRYTASLINDVQVGPSPQWVQDRLIKAGQRPINNIVDITNYVMLEYGQPLHAFDFESISEATIVVRRAHPGEVFLGLTGESMTLHPPMLVIADAQKPIGLAGIIGGANTEITDKTTTVLLESATFSSSNTRRTATNLRVRTEASTRFEKGLHPELAARALKRATYLIVTLAGSKVASGIVDIYPAKRDTQPITLRDKRIRQMLGTELPQAQIEHILANLGFRYQRLPNRSDATTGICKSVSANRIEWDRLLVIPPYWRTDVSIEEDLVEEVARTIGYDNIPTTMLSGGMPNIELQPIRMLREQVKDLLVRCGMQESISYSLVGRPLLERVDAWNHGPTPLHISNPMSTEQEYLRTTLWGSILSTLVTNVRRLTEGLRLFEAGRIYIPIELNLPQEREIVVGVLCGDRSPTSWISESNPLDFFDAKGTIETVLRSLRVPVHFRPHVSPIMHPGWCAQIVAEEIVVGLVGELHPRSQESFGIGAKVALFELDLESLLQVVPSDTPRFKSLPRFPSAIRDVAMIVAEQVTSDQLRALIEAHPMVTQAEVFDVYTGKKLPPNKRSLAYRISFQSPDGTLDTHQVNQAQQEILETLRHETDATLRG